MSKCYWFSIRKKILRNEKRCFRCLMTGHILKNAERATNITTAKGKFTTLRFVKTLLPSAIKNIVKVKNLLLTIMEKKKIKLLTDAKTDALLQKADCLISNPWETKILEIKLLLDPGSQKTYLSDGVKEYLKLGAIAKHNVAIEWNLWKHQWVVEGVGWV